VAQAIQKCKTSLDPGPFGIYTNRLTASYLESGGLSTLNTYINPLSDVTPYMPMHESTVYPSTETWGSSTAASTVPPAACLFSDASSSYIRSGASVHPQRG
jgi:hypothetical protein